MVIPWVKIVWISDFKGYGLIATQDIPKGTITFAQDGLDIVIPGSDLENLDPLLRINVEKYSYEDYLGNRIISWDLGKYMNHDDDANTLSTGYGFEVAIRDIKAGEEVTDDYRIFSTHHDTSFKQPTKPIESIKPWPKELIEMWDSKVFHALKFIGGKDQPLVNFVQPDLMSEVHSLQKNPNSYRSVSMALPLRYRLQTEGQLPEKRSL